jgi:ribosomal RNA-processing protein 17
VLLFQLREERKKELEEHVDAVNNILIEAGTIGFKDESEEDGDGWNGIQDDEPLEPIDHEAEYIDEDRYTTVTVEAVDVTKEGLQRVADEDDSNDEEAEEQRKQKAAEVDAGSSTKKVWPKKEKKKQFRYESKAERKVTRGKQKASNKSKANARRGDD